MFQILKNPNVWYIVFLCCIFLMFLIKRRESFQLYLAQPTKCVDCERQLPVGMKYMGQPSKCFDCEKHLEKSYGTSYGALGNPSKCLSCKSSYLLPKKKKKLLM